MTWNYEESVERLRPKLADLPDLTIARLVWPDALDVYHELWEAREALSASGAWAQYCEDVGLAKRTADRWLERYDAEG